MDLAVRASIFKWFSTRVKHVEIKLDEKKEELWTWSVPQKSPERSVPQKSVPEKRILPERKKKTKNAIMAGN